MPPSGSFPVDVTGDRWPALPDDSELHEPAVGITAPGRSRVAHLIAEQRGR